MKARAFLVLLIFHVSLFSVFSAKKPVMVVTEIAEDADLMFETANKALAKGDLRRAGKHFIDSYKLALSIDDKNLLTKICLSAISLKINSAAKNFDESAFAGTFLADSSEELVQRATKFAERSDNASILGAVCKIYSIRLAILNGESDWDGYISTLTSKEKELAKEEVYLAHLYRTKADVYIRKGAYSSARDYYTKAADLHIKKGVLGEIGMDFYDVARSCSLDGKKKDAIAAINKAIGYDRDAENTSGLGADYFAYAKILMKGSPSDDEKSQAYECADWASQIFDAGGFESDSEKCVAFRDSIFPK